jgi:6-phosphogluconolactonase
VEVELVVADDVESAARAAARELVTAVERGGHIALAGGSTPRRAYQLAALLCSDWQRCELWWGDERCVEPGDPRSNYRLVRESLLDGLSRLPRVVHRIRGELGGEAAAAAYDEEIRGVRLDLAFLGLGSDGHTASLFPHAPALEEHERLAVRVERPDVERVTLTPPVLAGAATVVVLAVGGEKAEAAESAFARPASPAVPASLIRGERTVAILDREAAARLAN